MKIVVHCTLALLLGASASIVALDFGRDVQPITHTKRRQQYHGFSVQPPIGSGWFVTISEQIPARATYRHPLPTKTHTFIASVVFGQLDKTVPVEEALVPHGLADSTRVQILENTHQADDSRKTKCIRYAIHFKDNHAANAPNEVLDMVDRGLVCVHPTIPDSFIRASYSERGLESELDPQLWADFEEFLRGIHIESAPGVPVA